MPFLVFMMTRQISTDAAGILFCRFCWTFFGSSWVITVENEPSNNWLEFKYTKKLCVCNCFIYVIIDVYDAEPARVVIAQPSARPWLGQDDLLLEILKSIVYGGLMEMIASLSVVASATVSDAATCKFGLSLSFHIYV